MKMFSRTSLGMVVMLKDGDARGYGYHHSFDGANSKLNVNGGRYLMSESVECVDIRKGNSFWFSR